MFRFTDRRTDKQTDRQSNRQADKNKKQMQQTGTVKNFKIYRQTDRHAYYRAVTYTESAFNVIKIFTVRCFI